MSSPKSTVNLKADVFVQEPVVLAHSIVSVSTR